MSTPSGIDTGNMPRIGTRALSTDVLQPAHERAARQPSVHSPLQYFTMPAAMDSLIIREAIPEDLPQLVEIYNHYVIHTPITFDLAPVTLAQRAEWMQQFMSEGRHRLFVWEEAGRVLGYADSHPFRAKPAYDTSVEVSCYCRPEAVGRRVGTGLYNALFAALRDADIGSYIAGVTVPNEASLALHARFGFTPVGTMHAVGRKFGKYWDVLWLERVTAG